MLVKKVIYRHRNQLLVINGASYRTELNRTRSAPPDHDKVVPEYTDFVIENKSKALTLETSDGKALTKELLDNFVDSSEEESRAEEFDDFEHEKALESASNAPTRKASTVDGEQSQKTTDASSTITSAPSIADTSSAAVKQDTAQFYVPPVFQGEEQEEKAVQPREHKRSHTIKSILECKERKKVELKYERSIFGKSSAAKISKLEPKKYDLISTFRLELNRAAKSTIEGVLSSIRNLKVRTEEEMIEMTGILFEKAITESSYLIIYVYIIKDLYKTFQCDDEKRSNSKNTVFFTTLCHMCKETFRNREGWTHSTEERDLSNLTMEERVRYENEYEEKEVVKLKKKGRTLGCIRLLGSLYCHSLISDTFVMVILRELLSDIRNPENIEIMCVFLDCCGEKLVKRHVQELNEVLRTLKDVASTTDKRTKFIILDTFDNVVPKWKKSPPKNHLGKNTFHGMVVEEDVHTEVPQQKIEHFIKNMMEDILSIECNHAKLKEMIDTIASRFSTKEFVSAYLGNVVESFGNVQTKTFIFNDLCRSFGQGTVAQSLQNIADNLEDLCCDAPYAASNFYKMLCYLRSDGLISRETFYEFRNEKFDNERKKILVEWLEDYGNVVRIDRVAEKEEMRDILLELCKSNSPVKYKGYTEKYNVSQ